MQAIRVHQFGGLDALVAEDVPRPVPGGYGSGGPRVASIRRAAGPCSPLPMAR